MKMIDPPSGWRFGFPKALPDDVQIGGHIKWMVENGYPQSEVDKYGEYFTYRVFECEEPKKKKTNKTQQDSLEFLSKQAQELDMGYKSVVYLVYYDNGERYEDHNVTVVKVFASKESADKYAKEKNDVIQTYKPSVSKEKYESEKWQEQNGYSYDDFIENEIYEWSKCRESKYFVREENVEQ